MKKLFAFLASLKLAVILLVLLLVGLSVGTIVETRAGAETAGKLVYYAWWFLALQGLFALNLALSLADLFPWSKRRVGFVVVHASLILIFVGSALTYFFKTEGSLALWEGETSAIIETHDPQGHVLSRHDLPFSVKLDDFVLETYQGTRKPSGFVSQVQITDHASGQTFPARIWMNHPLQYRGYDLFQSSYQQSMGREATVLSVSKDPGQTTVFVGFITLIAGMIIVLGTRMLQAGERAAAAAKAEAENGAKPSGKKGPGTARKALLALALVGWAGAALQASDLDTLRRLPVQHDGRVMPFDTLARETVWTVTGAHAWRGQDPAETMSQWLFDPKTAAAEPNIPLESKELAKALGLPEGTRHVSFIQLVQSPQLMGLLQAAHQAEQAQMPKEGVLADMGKLETRLMTLKAVLFREALRPIPVQESDGDRWAVPESMTPEALVQLMQGPRPAAWPTVQQIDREVLYNRLNPVRWSWIILLASLVAAIAAWVRSDKVLDRAAFGLLVGGFALISWGILLRWQAGGRIPAANMYESMLFLAWGVGLFAVIGYLVLKNRQVVLNAAVMATLTLALMDLLPIDRFIHPIAPVLAGTPWLAIHVPIIMIGYAVLALGLVVAHMQVGVAIFAPRRPELADRMYDLLYWYMFVGSIFLIAGIITGSMWAAASWGRYWGWDPKEVWSLVAFLAYMAILHAKLDRLIGKFGVAVISILAFQTIVMTYLGVNFVLNTGMHSYGMGDSPVVKWMVLVALAECAFIGWGLWAYRSHRMRQNED